MSIRDHKSHDLQTGKLGQMTAQFSLSTQTENLETQWNKKTVQLALVSEHKDKRTRSFVVRGLLGGKRVLPASSFSISAILADPECSQSLKHQSLLDAPTSLKQLFLSESLPQLPSCPPVLPFHKSKGQKPSPGHTLYICPTI